MRSPAANFIRLCLAQLFPGFRKEQLFNSSAMVKTPHLLGLARMIMDPRASLDNRSPNKVCLHLPKPTIGDQKS